jgi:hypothetical protein
MGPATIFRYEVVGHLYGLLMRFNVEPIKPLVYSKDKYANIHVKMIWDMNHLFFHIYGLEDFTEGDHGEC